MGTKFGTRLGFLGQFFRTTHKTKNFNVEALVSVLQNPLMVVTREYIFAAVTTNQLHAGIIIGTKDGKFTDFVVSLELF